MSRRSSAASCATRPASTALVAGDGALAAAGCRELAAWLAGRAALRGHLAAGPRAPRRALEPLAAAARGAGRSSRWPTASRRRPGGGRRASGSAARRGGGKRDSRLIAFGGGSVGDLAGFVAGCFLRGIELVQLPTTLLAQVDAAIGGKTGDRPARRQEHRRPLPSPRPGGRRHRFLATLPRAELRSGLVEVIKMAALLDPRPARPRSSEICRRLLAGDPAALGAGGGRRGARQDAVVERDPDEHGERRLLNFGHTLGHAIETAAATPASGTARRSPTASCFALRLAGAAACLDAGLGRAPAAPARPARPAAAAAARSRASCSTSWRATRRRARAGLAWVLPSRAGRSRADRRAAR